MTPFTILLTFLMLSFDYNSRSRDFFARALDPLNNKKGGNVQDEKVSQGKLVISPTTKVSRNKKKSRSNCCGSQELKCLLRMEGRLRYFSGKIQVCQSRSWRPLDSLRVIPKATKLPSSCLDAKFKGLDAGKGNGLYWINPSGVNDLRNSFLVYCDMTTAGGGWLLIAKITHEYAWVCPDRKGLSCFSSRYDPSEANLFHAVHERDFVDLAITKDRNSGIHLRNSKIRQLFQNGQQSVRFTFVTDETGWQPSEDGYAAFNRKRRNALFLDGKWVEYTTEKQDYTWNVIKHERDHFKFSGGILCWGNNVSKSYRYFEHGLHMGAPSNGDKQCHLANDEHEIMLKSHYTIVDDNPLRVRWDTAQFGFLTPHLMQVPSKRIALWVR